MQCGCSLISLVALLFEVEMSLSYACHSQGLRVCDAMPMGVCARGSSGWKRALETRHRNDRGVRHASIAPADKLTTYLRHDSALNAHARALSDLLPELSVVDITHIEMASQDEKWLQMMRNDVLVMTHAEFMETFEAGIIAFSQISLIVIDQPALALHANNHLSTISLALFATPKEEKPRVFGAIFQPDTNFEFSLDHLMIEERLGAQFYGIEQRKRAEMMALAEKPLELVVRFSPPSKVVDTALCKHLRTFDKHEKLYRKEFKAAKAV
jgi:endoribonuclease Dicer